MGGRQSLQSVVLGQLAKCKRMKLDHFLIPYTQLNSKWIKDLNTRPEITKLVQENIASDHFDLSHRQYFSR